LEKLEKIYRKRKAFEMKIKQKKRERKKEN